VKAIILSAGQGRRLLPLTASLPKCLLEVAGRTILEWQIDTLTQAGINDILVVTGYGADKVDALVRKQYSDVPVRTLYNARYATTDNLVSCWHARFEMDGDFLLLNGDTLFEAAVLSMVLECPDAPVTVTVNSKESYDSDDMKVILDHRRLLRIGKQLPTDQVQGESIGLIRFKGEGPDIFRKALEAAVQKPESTGRWYLSVIDSLADKMEVMTCSITGKAWCEIDYPEDLKQAESIMAPFISLPHTCNCKAESVNAHNSVHAH